MPRKDTTEKTNIPEEEIRGIFVLGLLAVLVTVRLQNPIIMMTIGHVTFDANLFLNLTIALWSFYAFFMVLGLSKDIVGENIAESSRATAKTFLICYFVMMAWFALIFGFYAYPTRLPYALGLLAILSSYVLWERLKNARKRLTSLSIKTELQVLVKPTLIFILFLSFMLIMFWNESWTLPLFLVGAFATVALIMVTERGKRSGSAH